MGLRSGWILTLLSVFLIAVAVRAQTADPQQRLQDQYQNKIFLLRGFYSNDKLGYDATGAPIANPASGFWTIDGFVLVTDAKVIGQSLSIKAKRMLVVSTGHAFQFRADTPKKRKGLRSVEIEAPLGPGSPSDAVDAEMAGIFLTNRDSFGALMPPYWEDRVSEGLRNSDDGKYAACRFSQELLSVPGMTLRTDQHASPEKDQADTPQNPILFRVGKGVSPPRPISTPGPQFSDTAREVNLRGAVTLGMTVDSTGMPRNVRILSPLGAGLDEEAVRTVRTWKFRPAEQEGHEPVAVEIAVEVDFHLQ
jgi:TonB family protein